MLPPQSLPEKQKGLPSKSILAVGRFEIGLVLDF
jgi:hypothetical protein